MTDTSNAKYTPGPWRIESSGPQYQGEWQTFVTETRAYSYPECDESEITGPLLRAADAALAKARGETI